MSERYRLIRLLGGGGMAEVYLAMAIGAEGFEKPVAIKRVLPHLARDEYIARMFLDEARLSRHLHHQNIVQVLDVGRGADGLFMAMELVNGWALSEVFDRCAKNNQRLPQVLAVYIAAQAAAGLGHAYRRTLDGLPLIIAHRDISPSNILLSAEGEVKVADFGIARLETRSNRTEPGTFKGKVPYAAPEVIRGQPATPASDQFALGVVLHMMLVGRHPFGHMDNLVLYAETLAKSDPPILTGVSPALAKVVRRMLEMQPERRYPSFEEISQALDAYLASTGVPASARELARYLESLGMPPPPLDRMAEGPQLAQPIEFGHRQSNPPHPVEPVSTSGPWLHSGPAIDASGRIDRPVAPSPAGAAAFASTGAPGPIPAQSTPDAPMDPNVIELAPLSSDLDISDEGRQWLQRPEQREAPPPGFEAVIDAPVTRRAGGLPRRLLVAVFSIGVLLVGAGVLLAQPKLLDILRQLQRRVGVNAATPILRIESTPPGATVHIAGQEVGRTPLYMENVYPPRDIDIRVLLPQHKVWTGTFKGGQDASVEARLVKR